MRFKIIDEKGRLWVCGWWVNIIDFFVIIFIGWTSTAFIYYGINLAIRPKTPAPVLYSEKQYQDLQQQYQELKEYQELKDSEYQMKITRKNAEITKLNNSINNFIKEHKHARKYFK